MKNEACLASMRQYVKRDVTPLFISCTCDITSLFLYDDLYTVIRIRTENEAGKANSSGMQRAALEQLHVVGS